MYPGEHPNPDIALFDRAPARDARLSRMLGDGALRPVGGVKRDALDLHGEGIMRVSI